jgi:hypothetical protein
MLPFGCRFAMVDDLTGILILEISGLKAAAGSVYIAIYDSDSTRL